MTIAEGLMDKGDALTGEERRLLELLVLLIEVFERDVEEQETEEDGGDSGDGDEPTPRPSETMARLLQARGWQPDALNDIFGNPKLVGEALGGTRVITRGQAKALGKLFRVPYKLFLSE